ncbi:MAG: DEAD/DEAH box helicase family protein, partial [Planctomycetes bacterium]|nr:DEAD/DEAH box helicase family protein [Planctomycetota bacterium]
MFLAATIGRDHLRARFPGRALKFEWHEKPTDPHVARVRISVEPPNVAGAPHSGALIRGEDDELLGHLASCFPEAVQVDVAVAFVLDRGMSLLRPYLEDVLDRGDRVRWITGDYFGVTEPNSLQQLLDLDGSCESHVFESSGTSFHPKSYVFHFRDGDGVAFVGSSNVSASALGNGVEWNYRILRSRDDSGFDAVCSGFERLLRHPRTKPLTRKWIEAYRETRKPVPPRPTGVTPEEQPPPAPHPIQEEALAALRESRERGDEAGLVVLATGLGKTWLSAFDSSEFDRVLFVAHREEILDQARKTFRRIRPSANLGLFTGSNKSPSADVVFASVQTLGKSQHLRGFSPDEFDYIIVDEFHHAAARTYGSLLEHFTPRFLLGLTATPERTDGADLLSLCGNNLVFHCGLAEGIDRGELCPFDYHGVPDDVDYEQIPWRSRHFDEEALTAQLATQQRAQNALEQHEKYGGLRTLGFCASQRHADFMATFFTENGRRAVAVHSGETSAPRANSLDALRRGDLDVVFSVDMFNEGVDVPAIDTVMMLRPTESRILWLQQLGRGLRKSTAKNRLRVIDYIGNHRSFLDKPRALLGALLGIGESH